MEVILEYAYQRLAIHGIFERTEKRGEVRIAHEACREFLRAAGHPTI